MKRSIALLLGLALLVGAGGVLARDGAGHSGAGAGHSGSARGGAVHFAGSHWAGGRPVVGVHPAPVFGRPGPVIVGRPGFHGHPIVRSTIIIGAPFFFYPYTYYAPPVYPAAVYSEPPAYVEQGASVLYYCPDYRDYYPNVASCPSPWMQVVPDGTGAYPN
jgi:hypothetical protein